MTTVPALIAFAGLLVLPRALMPGRKPREIRGFVLLLWWLNAGYCRFWHRMEVRGAGNVPAAGPVVLISNHTCNIDHMLLQAATRRALGFMIATEFYDNPRFRPFCRLIGCIPVRRDGRDLAATRAALRALEDGRVVPVFPEGKILPTSGRELGEGKPGVAFIAARARVPVVPAYIAGTPPSKDLARSFLTPSHSRVVFGPPVDLGDLAVGGRADRDALGAITDRLMDALRALRPEALDVLGPAYYDEARRDGPGPAGGPGALSRGREAVGRA